MLEINAFEIKVANTILKGLAKIKKTKIKIRSKLANEYSIWVDYKNAPIFIWVIRRKTNGFKVQDMIKEIEDSIEYYEELSKSKVADIHINYIKNTVIEMLKMQTYGEINKDEIRSNVELKIAEIQKKKHFRNDFEEIYKYCIDQCAK